MLEATFLLTFDTEEYPPYIMNYQSSDSEVI